MKKFKESDYVCRCWLISIFLFFYHCGAFPFVVPPHVASLCHLCTVDRQGQKGGQQTNLICLTPVYKCYVKMSNTKQDCVSLSDIQPRNTKVSCFLLVFGTSNPKDTTKPTEPNTKTHGLLALQHLQSSHLSKRLM